MLTVPLKLYSEACFFLPRPLLFFCEPPLPHPGCRRLLPPYPCHLFSIQQAKGFFKHVTQHSAMAICLTKSKSQSPFKVLHDLDAPVPHSGLFSNLLPHSHPATWTPHGSLNMPGEFLLHGLRTWCAICLECSSLRYLYGSPSCWLQVFTQIFYRDTFL